MATITFDPQIMAQHLRLAARLYSDYAFEATVLVPGEPGENLKETFKRQAEDARELANAFDSAYQIARDTSDNFVISYDDAI